MKTISRYIMTLALLITAVGGAWAQDIATPVISGETEFYDEVTVTITCATSDVDIYYTLDGSDPTVDSGSSTEIEYKKAFTLTETTTVKAAAYCGDAWSAIAEVTFTKQTGPKVTWDATTKSGTFEMPGSDVVLTPQYAPAAQLAENGEPAPVSGLEIAADAAIITAGQSAQGTLMYAIGTSATEAPALTAFAATLPNAKDQTAAGNYYVWYYIQGHDTPQGQEPSAENTFNDSEIMGPVTVELLTNEHTLNIKQSPNITVTVAGTAKTPTDDKVTPVTTGQEVKIKAKEGYKFRKVEVKKGVDYSFDLSTLTSNFEAMDGDILYGTTDKTVTIPNGAHVTLQGVNITSGAAIVCNGNATITLAAGSENIVTSTTEYNSGIRAGGNNTTLTINGTGKLTVKGAKRGAGIGSNRRGVCGNIVIEDGEIITTTGNYGAGIGSGYHATCGNITIKGGTITATGGNCGAGIGSSFDTAICGDILISGGTITAKGGSKAAGIGTGSAQQSLPSTCGNITITDGVNSVTATKGSSAAIHSIGKGQNEQDLAACGTVTIGGTEGYISTSPYTYDPHQQ